MEHVGLGVALVFVTTAYVDWVCGFGKTSPNDNENLNSEALSQGP